MDKINFSTKSYYGAIDGLRAFCFLFVFLFHCNIQGFQLGWSGVTIFFVISGFLITEILIKSKESKSYFKSFYMRRVLRIFPVYFIIIIGAVSTYFVVKKELPNDYLYYFSYTQNILWIFTNYISDLVPLFAHTWSLAIEEQFYLLWPLLIWLVPRKHLTLLCTCVVLFSISFRIVMVLLFNNEYATSILLFSQLDTLALGALLACYKQNISNNKINNYFIKNSLLVGFIGVLIIVIYIGIINGKNLLYAYDLLKNPTYYLNNVFTAQIYFFISLVAIGLIKICYNKSNFLTSLLSNKVLVHIGKISYGLYLYHWIVIAFVRRVIPSLSDSVIFPLIAFVVTLIISEVSYNTIEKYFNRYKENFKYD